MLSIRTQDRMALVPYRDLLEIIVLDDYGKKINDKIALCYDEIKKIEMNYSYRYAMPITHYIDVQVKKIEELKKNGVKKAIIVEKGNEYTLGIYKSKERCLEILDEIENCITVCMMNDESVVYHMPKEETNED